jgi:hypothetical protein
MLIGVLPLSGKMFVANNSKKLAGTAERFNVFIENMPSDNPAAIIFHKNI